MRKLLLLLLICLMPLAAQADVLGVAVDAQTHAVDLRGVKGVDGKTKALIADLQAHPEVQSVDLTGVAMSNKNKASLAAACPDVTFIWTVKLGNAVIDSTDTVMDLDAPYGEVKLSEIATALKALPNVQRVVMYKYRPKFDTLRTMLLDVYPDVKFEYSAKVGNCVVTTKDTVLDLDSAYGQVKLSEIATVLRYLPDIRHVSMFKQHPTLEQMRTILMEPFPEVTFDWTMQWEICRVRTINLRSDATAFSTLKGRMEPRYTADELWEYLQYFPEIVAVDVGHNNVSDLTFLTNYPGLKVLICVDSQEPLRDLSPLAELRELEYLELFMQDITDLSPLAGHDKLIDLNLCYNNITDLSPLYSCTSLRRLHISCNPNLTQEEVNKLKEKLPNCVVETRTTESTGAGWRENSRYKTIKNMFDSNNYRPFPGITW